MTWIYRWNPRSSAKKLGPIPTVISERRTCPTACALHYNGCYADSGPLALWWNKLSEGKDKAAISLRELCQRIKGLPKGTLWRYGMAGDLPGDKQFIDKGALNDIIDANVGRNGFTYTHYRYALNMEPIDNANAAGFTINLSLDNVGDVDYHRWLYPDVPLVTILPHDAPNITKTPRGNTIVKCLNVSHGLSCADCKLCAVSTRRVVVGFPAHGARYKTAERITGNA